VRVLLAVTIHVPSICMVASSTGAGFLSISKVADERADRGGREFFVRDPHCGGRSLQAM
jgi:hypothetical protein